MSITRNELLGKKVYNPDASLLGEVSDIGFAVGSSAPTLVVKGPDGGVAELSWGSVGSAKDIVLLKEAVDPSKFKRAQGGAAPAEPQAAVQGPVPGQKKFCTSCGGELSWIAQYKRWYCYKEKRYM